VTNGPSELSASEQERYRDQIAGELGVEGQVRLKHARAIVIGAGSTGAAAAAHLVSCGVGYVAVVDGGRIALGDLAGQALYYTPDVGHGRADVLAAKLGLLNPEAQVDSYPVNLEAQNAAAIAASHDLVLDCTGDSAAGAALDAAGVRVLRPLPGAASAAETGLGLAAEAIAALAVSPDEALA
jgi:molybdopterin/thiamine biosynthesis adenylyltransferase